MRRSKAPPNPRLVPSLDWSASVHDDSQFEITVDYSVVRWQGPSAGGGRGDGGDEGGGGAGEGCADHETAGAEPTAEPAEPPGFTVDLFLVAPPARDIDPSSYPKRRFWSDLTQRMRLHTPVVPAFGEGRIPALDHYLALGLDLDAKGALEKRAVQDVKLFANFINLRLKQVFVGNEPRPGLRYKRDLRRTVELVRRYRERYLGPTQEAGLLVGEELADAVEAVEAYLSDRIERALSRATLAGTIKARKDLAAERARRPEEPERLDPLALEQYGVHHSRLKKLVSEILYLHPREIRRDQLYRNAAAAVGAGVAAAFAETARFYNTVATGTTDFGLRVAFFLSIAVVAYVFKDRLKDFSKEYVGRRFSKRLPDRDTHLLLDYVDPHARARTLAVVRHREWVRYTSTDRLPADAGYVWARSYDEPQQLRDRDVLHYGKVVVVRPEAVRQLEFDDLSVKEVMRFDTTTFLSRLDNPLKELALFDSEEGAVVLQAPKVYHLDVVLRLATSGPDGGTVRFEALRVVLDKHGIVRIDRPVPVGRYGYREAAS